jgi:hypothetical protein
MEGTHHLGKGLLKASLNVWLNASMNCFFFNQKQEKKKQRA